MGIPERGTKRLCPNCGAKYYDLNRDPIICPKCSTVFVVEAAEPPPKPAPEPVEEKEEATADADSPEVISLEEAEAEELKDVPDVPDIEDSDGDNLAADDDSDKFLEEDEDDELSQVSGIIGDVETDEEET